MALTQSSLSGKLQTELSNVFTIVDNDVLVQVCDAIAQAIVDEIQQNAVVNTSVANVQGGASVRTGIGTVS
jgi:hypothetical protein